MLSCNANPVCAVVQLATLSAGDQAASMPAPSSFELIKVTRPVSIMTQLLQQIRQGEVDEGLWKALNASLSVLFPYPAAQVQRTIEGGLAIDAGETSNPSALLFGPPR